MNGGISVPKLNSVHLMRLQAVSCLVLEVQVTEPRGPAVAAEEVPLEFPCALALEPAGDSVALAA